MGNLGPRASHWVGEDFFGAASWSEALPLYLSFPLYLSQVLPPQHISSSPNAVSLPALWGGPTGNRNQVDFFDTSNIVSDRKQSNLGVSVLNTAFAPLSYLYYM